MSDRIVVRAATSTTATSRPGTTSTSRCRPVRSPRCWASGSGKSTLLRGYRGPGTNPHRHHHDQRGATNRTPPQRRGIGFVFQHYAAFKHLTVRDNVAFGLKIRKRPKAEITRTGRHNVWKRSGWLAPRPLPQRNGLRGDQRQRMALARTWRHGVARCCCSTNAIGALDPRCVRICGAGRRGGARRGTGVMHRAGATTIRRRRSTSPTGSRC